MSGSQSLVWLPASFSALFLSFLTVMAILLMAVGKYYNQTKALSFLKKREPPTAEYLDQDLQHLVSEWCTCMCMHTDSVIIWPAALSQVWGCS